MADSNHTTLERERQCKKSMYLMKIVECTNRSAKKDVHRCANPYVAHELARIARSKYRNLDKDFETAGAILDTDFLVGYRGENLGFTVVSPTSIYTSMQIMKPRLSVTSDTGIHYVLTFAEYTGPSSMGGTERVPKFFGYGNIPPTAAMHPDVNTESALITAFENALISAGMKPYKVAIRKNIAGNPTTDMIVEWTIEGDPNRHHFYKSMRVPLPSGDEGTIRFSATFCSKFDLHMQCGKPNDGGGHGKGRTFCTRCASRRSGDKGKKKRSFDDMFDDLNKA